MKKFFSLLCLTVFLLSFAAVGVRAAGSVSLSGPSTVRAGDSITVTFYAGGGIYGGNGTVVYDGALLTLQGYTPQVGGSWAVGVALWQCVVAWVAALAVRMIGLLLGVM